MRQVEELRSQAPDPTAATNGAARDCPAGPTEPAASAAGYSADHAAIVFGIPRIAPVPSPRRRGRPGPPAPPLPAAGEDVTESLTADERAAAGAFADPDPVVEQEISDPVTAALHLPVRHGQEARAAWGGAQRQPLTERLVVAQSPTLPPTPISPRSTAVLTHLGRDPGEAATASVTLPPAQGNAVAFGFAADFGSSAGAGSGSGLASGEASYFRLAKWGLLGAAAVLTLVIAALVGRALTLHDLWPGVALRPTPIAPRAPGAYRERLLEQAVVALRDGHREQAVGLLLRYQASEPAGSAEPAVDILLRVLKKDLGVPRH